jgi:hypothetical protein
MHEKHVAATCKLVTFSSICLKTQENQENPCHDQLRTEIHHKDNGNIMTEGLTLNNQFL